MALSRISNLSLADQVFKQLLGEIMHGGYEADSYLPAERTLSVTFNVNRHVVREALKRLEQIGLVRVAQGGGTRVLDFRHSAGLDLLGPLAEHPEGGSQALAFWHSVLEVRAAQASDIVRLCSARASAALKQELVDLTLRMQRTSDPEALYELELLFWDRAIEGADNIVYRLSYNSIRRAAEVMGEQARAFTVGEIKAASYRVPLAAAIAAGAGAEAEAHMRASVRVGLERLEQLIRGTGNVKAATPPEPKASVAKPAKPKVSKAKRSPGDLTKKRSASVERSRVT